MAYQYNPSAVINTRGTHSAHAARGFGTPPAAAPAVRPVQPKKPGPAAALNPQQFAPLRSAQSSQDYWVNATKPTGGFYGRKGSGRGRLQAAGMAAAASMRVRSSGAGSGATRMTTG